jgi:DNA-binding NarL/FixJ family response regulator
MLQEVPSRPSLSSSEGERTGVAAPPCRVLIVDDYPNMQQALVSCVEPLEGYEVVGTASNGEQALELIASVHPDVIIADLQMPVMDGFQMLRLSRQRYPEVHLIAISGHFSPVIEKEAIAAGADVFISKVGLPDALIQALASVAA